MFLYFKVDLIHNFIPFNLFLASWMTEMRDMFLLTETCECLKSLHQEKAQEVLHHIL